MVKSIYNDYIVSFETACRRVVELGIYRVIFLMFNKKRLFYFYHSPNFILYTNEIKEVLRYECPKIIKGKTIQKELKLNDKDIMLHLHRFNTGTYLAAFVEEDPIVTYKKVLELFGAAN